MPVTSETPVGILQADWYSHEPRADFYVNPSQIFTAPQLSRYARNIGILIRVKKLEPEVGQMQFDAYQKMASSVGVSPARLSEIYEAARKETPIGPSRAS